jgi:hypothetical protein
MAEGGGSGMRLVEILVVVVVAVMMLNALQAALCQLMPFIVIMAAIVGLAVLVWAVVRRRNNHW